jgi:hypothetical protein
MIEAQDCKQNPKAITTADISLPAGSPKTKAWDPSKAITTGNIEAVREANAKEPAGPPKFNVTIDESAGPGAAAWMDKQFKADATKAAKAKKGKT